MYGNLVGLVHTVEHTANLFSVFVDSDSDPDSKIWDLKMSGLDSRKKLLDWMHYAWPCLPNLFHNIYLALYPFFSLLSNCILWEQLRVNFNPVSSITTRCQLRHRQTIHPLQSRSPFTHVQEAFMELCQEDLQGP